MSDVTPVEQKHSRLGIASFVMSLVIGLLTLVLFGIAGVLETTTPGGLDENSSAAIVIGLCMFALLFVGFVALSLGVAGVLQKDRKRLFAVLGAANSFLILLGTIGLVAAGLMME